MLLAKKSARSFFQWIRCFDYSISQIAAERKLFSYEKLLEKILDSFPVQTDITCREINVVT